MTFVAFSRTRGLAISEETKGFWDVGKVVFQKFGFAILKCSVLVFLTKEQSFLAADPSGEQSWHGRPLLTWGFSLYVSTCFQQLQAGYLHKSHRPGDYEGAQGSPNRILYLFKASTAPTLCPL